MSPADEPAGPPDAGMAIHRRETETRKQLVPRCCGLIPMITGTLSMVPSAPTPASPDIPGQQSPLIGRMARISATGLDSGFDTTFNTTHVADGE